MKHLQKIGDMDVTALCAAVAATADRFRDLTFRQLAPGTAHSDTETIYLRMPPEISRATVFESMEVADYPVMQYDAFRSAVEGIAALSGCKAARAMVIKLKPGGAITQHVDQGAYAEATERFHLPIMTNDLSWLRSGGDFAFMKPGEVWWFDKGALHEGANHGDTDRIHLVVDVFAC